MKKIEIIIPNRGFTELDKILKDEHVGGVSYSRIEGRGKSKAKEVSVGRGTTHYVPDYIPRLKIEVVVKDNQVEGIVKKIVDALGGPALGGKIFVVDVPFALDLTTKERGESAL